MKLINNIKILIQKHNAENDNKLTQTSLAWLCGITQSAVSRWIRGKANPKKFDEE